MGTVVRNVGDIDAQDRRALEHVLGQRLSENQRLVIGVVDLRNPPEATPSGAPTLPEWCNVYSGLSDDEVADLEKSILQRADFSRPSK